jgi:RNA recognition motif-containing protein
VGATDLSLYKYFSRFGDIESIKTLNPRGDNTSYKKVAFINFFKPEDARKAKSKMEGKNIGGHPIYIKWGKKLTLNQTNSVSNCAFDLLPHIYVNIPENPKNKIIIDRVANLINEVKINILNFF